MRLGRTSDGAFDLEETRTERVGDQAVVTVLVKPRWWSWRYWRFVWLVRRSMRRTA